jgi:DNA-binding transcriptional ArsR family regulator
MDKNTVIAALSELAHPIRLDAFRLLVRAGREGLTPGRMVDALGIPYAKLGFHLKELSIAGLVTQEQSGRFVIYRAAYEQMNGVLDFLTENCCKGVPDTALAEDSTSCAC